MRLALYLSMATPDFDVTASPSAANALVDQVYQINVAIAALDTSTDFTGADTYALAPSSAALPAGLSMSAAGVITGTPTALTTVQISIVVRGSNEGGFADSAFTMTVATVPSAFVVGDWALADPATDGDLSVTINDLPDDGGTAISDIKYRVDTGAWTSSGGLTDFTISGLTNDALTSVELRAVNQFGDGAIGDLKSETPTAGVDVTAPVLSASSFDGTDTVSLTSDEAGTLYWMVDDNATRTAAQVKTGGGLASGSYAAENGANNDVIDVSAVQGGTHYLHLMIEDASANQSTVDSVEYTFSDTVAPTLTSPTDAANGATASTASVSTDEADGTIYVVVTTSATAPTAAQVKLGQDNLGAAAAFSASQAVSATGVQTITPAPSGLTASTAYTTHFMHEDSDGNQSAVSTASGFTTGAAAGITRVGGTVKVVAASDPDNAAETVNYTVIGTANTVIAVRVSWESGITTGETPTSIALDGSNMNLEQHNNNSRTNSIIAWLAPATTGAQDVVVTMPNTMRSVHIAVDEYSGVDGTTPVEATGNSGSGSTSSTGFTGTITPVNDNTKLILIGAVFDNGSSAHAFTTGTQDFITRTGTNTAQDGYAMGGSKDVSTGGAETIVASWTGGARYSYSMIELNPA